MVPGYTRAIGIVQPTAVAHHNEPAPDDVVLIPVSPETQAVALSVYFERPGANLNGRPGKNADGTLFVRRMPVAQDTGTCCIIAKHEPLQPSIPLTGPGRATPSWSTCGRSPPPARWRPPSSASRPMGRSASSTCASRRGCWRGGNRRAHRQDRRNHARRGIELCSRGHRALDLR